MCELYCPVDALYVAPEVEPLTAIEESELIAANLLGSYRKNIGWGPGRNNGAKQDRTFQILKQL